MILALTLHPSFRKGGGRLGLVGADLIREYDYLARGRVLSVGMAAVV